jgi:hypothetical protein
VDIDSHFYDTYLLPLYFPAFFKEAMQKSSITKNALKISSCCRR